MIALVLYFDNLTKQKAYLSCTVESHRTKVLNNAYLVKWSMGMTQMVVFWSPIEFEIRVVAVGVDRVKKSKIPRHKKVNLFKNFIWTQHFYDLTKGTPNPEWVLQQRFKRDYTWNQNNSNSPKEYINNNNIQLHKVKVIIMIMMVMVNG